jgi:phosphohistidine phosphatase SixA
MLVLLVRHGHAGTKRHWRGDDSVRPLDEQGFAEAAALARSLAPFVPARIISSPFLRCVQTVTPLSESLGVRIERSQSLVPEAGAAATLLAREVSVDGDGAGAVVLCTHGEVIHDMQTRLAHDGPAGFSGFGPASLREKGSVWVLDRTEGRFIAARHLPPPPVV